MKKYKTWRIWGTLNKELPALYINAESFDKALAIARRYDRSYDTGQINDEYIKDANHYFIGDNPIVDKIIKNYEIRG